MCDKDRCAVIAKQLNDFLYMYCRETDLYTDSEDQQGCVSNIHFAQFLYSARYLPTVLRIPHKPTTQYTSNGYLLFNEQFCQ